MIRKHRRSAAIVGIAAAAMIGFGGSGMAFAQSVGSGTGSDAGSGAGSLGSAFGSFICTVNGFGSSTMCPDVPG
jgi:hypothetical protein